MKKICILMVVVTVLVGCHRKSDAYVARAYDNYLYASDLKDLVPKGTSPEDSVAIVSAYINQWVQQMVVLEKANRNVSDNFEKELQNYKNSLLTYEYERLIVEQMLDTNVSESEIEQYYEANRSNFVLRTGIVKVVYVKVPNGLPSIAKFKKLLNRAPLSDKNLMEVQQLASTYAEDYHFDRDEWIPFHSFRTAVPVEAYNESSFLHNNRYIEISDKQYTYIAQILDYKTVDDVSPLEYEHDNIRTIILNQRKIEIIKNMQRDLLKEANAKGKIEIK